jgi:hypothetical protein
VTRYTLAEWHTEGSRRFGPVFMDWKFVCPVCGNVASVRDFRPFKNKGSTPNSATCECIGRFTNSGPSVKGSKPCNYAGYGLFRLSPIVVLQPDGQEVQCFAFAEPSAESTSAATAARPSGDQK